LFRNFQAQELLLVLLIVLLIFGARKLPDLARSLGASAKEFRKGVSEGSQDEDAEAQVTEAQAADVPAPEAAAPETPTPDGQKPG
jgi:sec-independent protein translocase protein TatA